MCPIMDFEQLHYQAEVNNNDSVISNYKKKINNISDKFRMKNLWWNCQQDYAILFCK